jgi:hypothetical protein
VLTQDWTKPLVRPEVRTRAVGGVPVCQSGGCFNSTSRDGRPQMAEMSPLRRRMIELCAAHSYVQSGMDAGSGRLF